MNYENNVAGHIGIFTCGRFSCFVSCVVGQVFKEAPILQKDQITFLSPAGMWRLKGFFSCALKYCKNDTWVRIWRQSIKNIKYDYVQIQLEKNE